MIEKYWMLSWCEEQGQFHIGNMREECDTNLEIYMSGLGGPNYITVGVFEKLADASKVADALKIARENKQTILESA